MKYYDLLGKTHEQIFTLNLLLKVARNFFELYFFKDSVANFSKLAAKLASFVFIAEEEENVLSLKLY